MNFRSNICSHQYSLLLWSLTCLCVLRTVLFIGVTRDGNKCCVSRRQKGASGQWPCKRHKTSHVFDSVCELLITPGHKCRHMTQQIWVQSVYLVDVQLYRSTNHQAGHRKGQQAGFSSHFNFITAKTGTSKHTLLLTSSAQFYIYNIHLSG